MRTRCGHQFLCLRSKLGVRRKRPLHVIGRVDAKNWEHGPERGPIGILRAYSGSFRRSGYSSGSHGVSAISSPSSSSAMLGASQRACRRIGCNGLAWQLPAPGSLRPDARSAARDQSPAHGSSHYTRHRRPSHHAVGSGKVGHQASDKAIKTHGSCRVRVPKRMPSASGQVHKAWRDLKAL